MDNEKIKKHASDVETLLRINQNLDTCRELARMKGFDGIADDVKDLQELVQLTSLEIIKTIC